MNDNANQPVAPINPNPAPASAVADDVEAGRQVIFSEIADEAAHEIMANIVPATANDRDNLDWTKQIILGALGRRPLPVERIRQMERDSERLNWLATNQWAVRFWHFNDQWEVTVNENIYGGKTIREAIDKAMGISSPSTSVSSPEQIRKEHAKDELANRGRHGMLQGPCQCEICRVSPVSSVEQKAQQDLGIPGGDNAKPATRQN